MIRSVLDSGNHTFLIQVDCSAAVNTFDRLPPNSKTDQSVLLPFSTLGSLSLNVNSQERNLRYF